MSITDHITKELQERAALLEQLDKEQPELPLLIEIARRYNFNLVVRDEATGDYLVNLSESRPVNSWAWRRLETARYSTFGTTTEGLSALLQALKSVKWLRKQARVWINHFDASEANGVLWAWFNEDSEIQRCDETGSVFAEPLKSDEEAWLLARSAGVHVCMACGTAPCVDLVCGDCRTAAALNRAEAPVRPALPLDKREERNRDYQHNQMLGILDRFIRSVNAQGGLVRTATGIELAAKPEWSDLPGIYQAACECLGVNVECRRDPDTVADPNNPPRSYRMGLACWKQIAEDAEGEGYNDLWEMLLGEIDDAFNTGATEQTQVVIEIINPSRYQELEICLDNCNWLDGARYTQMEA